MTQLERLRASIMKDSLYRFMLEAWHVIDSANLEVNWHLETICRHVQALIADEPGSPQNLLINVPPGTCKSLIFSVFAPAWIWLKKPQHKMLFASGAPSVVTRDSMRCRALIKSEWYQKTFTPKWGISKDQDEKQHFSNTAGGWRKGVAAGAGITGERADLLGVDDPNDAKEIHSKAHRETINERWWATAFHNRIADPARSKRGVIMQRLHEEDLTGFLLEREKGKWAHLALQMEFDPKGPGDRPTWLGWSDPRISEGELLMPDRFTHDYLSGERAALGTAGYAGQMQQLPAPAKGNRFLREWWRFWSPTGQRIGQRPQGCTEVPPVRFNPSVDKWDELIGSWDCAFKDGDANDFVVGLTVYRQGARRFLVQRVRDHLGFKKTQDAIEQQTKDWPSIMEVLVEDKANGSAVIETLAALVPGIIAVEPKGGKEARAAIMEPKVEAGNWYLPEGAEWLGEWVEEFASFPLGKHDDQVDAASQAEARFLEDSEVAAARALLGMRR